MSAKRRRAIGIEKTIVRALKAEAEKGGEKGHTSVATKIFVGDRGPISFSVGEREGPKSVSMKESLWLSIKVRAEARGLSSTAAAESILLGEDAHLTRSEIKEGEKMARSREASRPVESKPKKKAKPKREKKPKKAKAEKKPEVEPVSTADVKDETLAEEEERRRRQSKLSKGVPLEGSDIEKRSAFKKLNIEEEQHFGGVYSL